MLKVKIQCTGGSGWELRSLGGWSKGVGCPCTTHFQKEGKAKHKGGVMAKECCLNGVDAVSELVLENSFELACANN